MCGIFVSVQRAGTLHGHDQLKPFLDGRGPDSRRLHEISFPSVSLSFYATVLAMRGSDVVPQPLVDQTSGSVLCWNGEAWRIRGEKVVGNDTNRVFELLLNAASDPDANSFKIATALASIAGPFAFVFYDATSATVYFGRDRLGRRSLLLTEEPDSMKLCSVSDGSSAWKEVEADGIQVLRPNGSFNPSRIPWAQVTSIPSFNGAPPPKSITTLMPSCHAVTRLRDLLSQSLALRLHNENPSEASDIAILFSGGLDCTIIALLSHQILPPERAIKLVNVAFQNPRVHGDSDNPYELCPDRKTARASLAELQLVCPERTWRLVEINIPYSEAMEHRSAVISLMHPHSTEMDLSISIALYFAARGSGTSRVLLSGLGADELFGGYQRHATAFCQRGFEGLRDELMLDFDRLGQRNLGRDDRVISHWAREVRYPYLDEDLVEWAISAPAWEKCGFMHDSLKYSPDKLVLRLLAAHLGIHRVAAQKKRAIQFGARTAKMEYKKSRGTDLISS